MCSSLKCPKKSKYWNSLSPWINPVKRNEPDQHLKPFTLYFISFSFMSWNAKNPFLSFHCLLVCQVFKPEDLKQKKNPWLSMNQQCVSMWVDKTASSRLVRFSLSYSVGQKVMPTGFKSHWKGPSCSARYCFWASNGFFFTLIKETYQQNCC